MKIAVALSGGVDSSSALLKLLDEGNNDVIGITMVLNDENDTHLKRASIKDIEDARNICNHFGIKHYILDVKKIFKDKIISYFIKEYLNARTPNPCLICNPIIKFGIMKNYANSLGYEYFATGHYARIEKENNQIVLKKGIDTKKDQSYFLSLIPKKLLEKIIFPLGNYTKGEIRSYLESKGLHIASKKESQEICFIKNNDYRNFIKTYTTSKIENGIIEDENGNFLGYHKGLPFYTIGQRRGLNIAFGKPIYVRELKIKENKLIVGNKKKSKEFFVKNINWFYEYEKIKNRILQVKIRYRGKLNDCHLEKSDLNSIKIIFKEPVSSITPGQGAVLYLGDIVVAGGIIDKVN